MTHTIRLIIKDHLEGDNSAMMGMFHWLIVECEVPLTRIAGIAERRLGIPRVVLMATLGTIWE